MKKYIITQIKWDTDGKKIKLPKTLNIEVDNDFYIEFDGADLLSDKYGFCVIDFKYREVK